MPSTEREIVGTTLLSQKSQPPRILTPGVIKATGCIGLVANALVPGLSRASERAALRKMPAERGEEYMRPNVSALS
jgi:hypothetical protein